MLNKDKIWLTSKVPMVENMWNNSENAIREGKNM